MMYDYKPEWEKFVKRIMEEDLAGAGQPVVSWIIQ